jgi:hypothetical protein
MALRVLEGGTVHSVEAYRAAPFDLAVHPMRPGIAHDEVTLVLGPELALTIEQAAARDGAPTPLWASVAIESERALVALAQIGRAGRAALETSLDTAAVPTSSVVLVRGGRVASYAKAVRIRAPRAAAVGRSTLVVPVPHHTRLAWELAARVEGESLSEWAAALLAAAPLGRLSWEAAAAEAGQTLGEWVAVQAARRMSD